MSADDPYLYPGTSVLKNKLGIIGAAELDHVERRLVTQRVAEGTPQGRFNLDHLKAIHRHLFQDVYAWAGEVRSVELNKSGQQFQFRQYIETGMADVHKRIVSSNFLNGLSREAFSREAAIVIGDVNYVHPFREGNGRTQLFFLDQLAEQAGHPLDFARIDPECWIEASRQAHTGDYAAMAKEIGRVSEGREERGR